MIALTILVDTKWYVNYLWSSSVNIFTIKWRLGALDEGLEFENYMLFFSLLNFWLNFHKSKGRKIPHENFKRLKINIGHGNFSLLIKHYLNILGLVKNWILWWTQSTFWLHFVSTVSIHVYYTWTLSLRRSQWRDWHHITSTFAHTQVIR